MHQLTVALLSKVVVVILVVCALVALFVGRLHRALRVSPDQQSGAPLTWLVALSADARLHRRLKSIAAHVREMASGGPRHRRARSLSPSQRLARDVEAELIHLDERLVAARQLDFDSNRRAVKSIRSDVDTMETIVKRLSRSIKSESDNPAIEMTGLGIDELLARLDHIEQAHDSIKVIDTGATQAADLELTTGAPAIPATAVEAESA